MYYIIINKVQTLLTMLNDLTIVAIALLSRYTLSMSLKLTDIIQWNVGAVVLEQF